MIVSHKHKFIFLKTNKTAGTSIEIAISKFCGPEDIITPITPEDERTRRELGYVGPQNYLAPVSDYRAKDLAKLLVLRRRKRRYFNHIGAREVQATIGEHIWESYYKFCIERNPWDRVISLYHHIHQLDPRPSISDFIDSEMPLVLKRRGFDLYTIDGAVAVDRICRFENLSEELEEVRRGLGISESLDLPRAKSKFRKDSRSYREILGDSERDRIAGLFSEEINLLGYEY